MYQQRAARERIENLEWAFSVAAAVLKLPTARFYIFIFIFIYFGYDNDWIYNMIFLFPEFGCALIYACSDFFSFYNRNLLV